MSAAETPIYVEAIREAKRRTRRHSPERAALTEMDARTEPQHPTDLTAITALNEEN